MNYNSINAVTPVGGDDLDRAGQCLELRYAKGSESFTPLGRPDTSEHPDPEEIIYVVSESGAVMCRRWNWRNGHKTLIAEETRTIVMNIDCLGEDSEEKVVITRDQVAKMLVEFCGAEVITTILSPSQMSYQFTM
jgi:DNA/RNA-binding domain of Phe-tRNA-synthetase-like protein